MHDLLSEVGIPVEKGAAKGGKETEREDIVATTSKIGNLCLYRCPADAADAADAAGAGAEGCGYKGKSWISVRAHVRSGFRFD